MSRIGKKPIAIPAKVDITVENQTLSVKGPKGTLSMELHPNMQLQVEDGTINVVRPNDERMNRALHGLTRSLVNNLVEGVSTGFRKTLIIDGVGYAAELRGNDLVLKLGFSHEVVIPSEENISYAIEGRNPTTLHIDGIDKQRVGQIAANIRKLRPPEPYLGKGVRYSTERIRRKAGKTGK